MAELYLWKMHYSLENYHFRAGSLLEGLPKKEYKALKDSMIRVTVKKGTTLLHEGKPSKGVYILRKGKVKIFQTNKEGKEQIPYIYTKGEYFGYRPLINNTPTPVSAATLEDCVLSFIPKKVFMEVLGQSNVLSYKLLENLSHEFTVWINKLTVFGQQSVKERLALSLLILSEKYRIKDSKEHVEINLSREDLANYVGTAVETVVRMLQHFKEQKVIITRGRKIIVLKPKELESTALLF